MDVFNTPVSRKGTYCTQWDFCEDRFGVKDVASVMEASTYQVKIIGHCGGV